LANNTHPPPNQYDWDKYGLVYYGGMVENHDDLHENILESYTMP